jgi:hypothetical protein
MPQKIPRVGFLKRLLRAGRLNQAQYEAGLRFKEAWQRQDDDFTAALLHLNRKKNFAGVVEALVCREETLTAVGKALGERDPAAAAVATVCLQAALNELADLWNLSEPEMPHSNKVERASP